MGHLARRTEGLARMTLALFFLVWFLLACAIAPPIGRVLAKRSAELEEIQ